MPTNIRAWTLQGLPELVAELGGDATSLFRQYRIPRDLMNRPDAVLPSRTFMRLLESCAVDLGCRDFGLRFGYRLGPEALGPIAMVARHCATAREATEAIARYIRVYMPAVDLRLQPIDAQSERLLYELRESDPASARQFLEWSMGVSLRVLRLLLGANATPHAISFEHTPLLPAGHYRKFFGCACGFNRPFTAFDLRTRDLQRRLANDDPRLRQVLANYIEQMSIASDATLEEQLRGLIPRLLPTGRCSIKLIADHFSVSVRTFQRRMEREGLYFDRLLDDVRRERAGACLADRSLSAAEIAALLGFAEQSSFTNACRRWFGKSPREWRRAVP